MKGPFLDGGGGGGGDRGSVSRLCLSALLPISLNCFRASKDKVSFLKP